MAQQAKAFFVGTLLATVAVGFAYAMPAAVESAARQHDAEARKNAAAPSPSPTQTTTATLPSDDELEQGEKDGATENHGAAVSTAAHCPVKGRAHGELVRSIATDKDATTADAEAACAQALAEASDQSKAHGKGAQRAKQGQRGKPASAGQPSGTGAGKPSNAGKPDASGKSKSSDSHDGGSAASGEKPSEPQHGGGSPGSAGGGKSKAKGKP